MYLKGGGEKLASFNWCMTPLDHPPVPSKVHSALRTSVLLAGVAIKQTDLRMGLSVTLKMVRQFETLVSSLTLTFVLKTRS